MVCEAAASSPSPFSEEASVFVLLMTETETSALLSQCVGVREAAMSSFITHRERGRASAVQAEEEVLRTMLSEAVSSEISFSCIFHTLSALTSPNLTPAVGLMAVRVSCKDADADRALLTCLLSPDTQKSTVQVTHCTVLVLFTLPLTGHLR